MWFWCRMCGWTRHAIGKNGKCRECYAFYMRKFEPVPFTPAKIDGSLGLSRTALNRERKQHG